MWHLASQFLILSLVLFAPAANADLLFQGDFETGRIYPQKGGKVDSFFYGAFNSNCEISNSRYSASNDNRVVASDARVGSYANAQTIRFNCDYRPLNGGGYQKPRQSLKVVTDSLVMKEGKEYWLAFSLKLGDSWVSDYEKNPDYFFQLLKEASKDAPDAREHSRSVVQLIEYDNKFRLVSVDQTVSGNEDVTKDVYAWASKKGEWQDIVINFKLCRSSKQCSGFVDMYVGNDQRRKSGAHMKPVMKQRGINTTAAEHTLALNLYKFAWHCQDTFEVGGKKYSRDNYSACMKNTNPTRSKKDRTVYFDELRVGDSNSSITEVSPHFKTGKSDGKLLKLEESAPLPPLNAKVR